MNRQGTDVSTFRTQQCASQVNARRQVLGFIRRDVRAANGTFVNKQMALDHSFILDLNRRRLCQRCPSAMKGWSRNE